MPELVDAINEYIAHHNTDPKPYIWTKSARDILQKIILRQQPLKFQTEWNTALVNTTVARAITSSRLSVG
ncbi:MAG: hypothetical protein ACN6OP_23870 [Pseudomonadales bacterium]